MNEVQRFIDRFDEVTRKASSEVMSEMIILAVAEFGVIPREVTDDLDARIELEVRADYLTKVGRFL